MYPYDGRESLVSLFYPQGLVAAVFSSCVQGWCFFFFSAVFVLEGSFVHEQHFHEDSKSSVLMRGDFVTKVCGTFLGGTFR